MGERLTKTVVVLITFLAVWVILIGLITPDFFVYAKEYTSYQYPSYFTQEDIENIKYFINYSITFPEYGKEYDFNAQGAMGTYVLLRWEHITYRFLMLQHETWRLWFIKSYETMTLNYQEYVGRVFITLDVLQEFWSSETNVSRVKPISCPTLSVTLFVSDTNTSRNDIEEAWNDGQIMCGIGFGLDDWQAKYSAWTLIAKLLLWQAPETTPYLDDLVAIPFWTATCIVIVLIIVKFIPFGGG